MSFADDVKEELFAHISQDRSAQQAGLAALLLCIGRFSWDPDGKMRLELKTDDRRALTKCFTLFQKTANITAESCGGAEEGPIVVSDMLPQNQVQQLAALCGCTDGKGTLPGPRDLSRIPLRTDQAARSFLRNTFLCLGQRSTSWALPARNRTCQIGFSPCFPRETSRSSWRFGKRADLYTRGMRQ